MKYYETDGKNFYFKSFASAGIRLAFKTDSKSLRIKINTFRASGRGYYMLEVLANGKTIGEISNFPEEIPERYVFESKSYTFGDAEGEFSLGEGTKTV